MKPLIRKILVEGEYDKVVQILSRKGFQRNDSVGIYNFLSELSYDDSEIKDIFKQYFTGGKSMTDMEIFMDLISQYEPLDDEYDVKKYSYHFFDDEGNLIFIVDNDYDTWIPKDIYEDMIYLDIIKWDKWMKKYFIDNFGIRVNNVFYTPNLG